MKTHAHTMLAFAILIIAVSLLSSSSAHAQNTVMGSSPPPFSAAGVKGLPGGQSGSFDCRGAGGFVPLECFEGSTKLRSIYKTDDLGPFMEKVFAGGISLGAILAVLRLAWAGFSYMASDLPGVKSNAKEIIGDTLLGLFLLLGIWLILYQINPEILNLELTFTPP